MSSGSSVEFELVARACPVCGSCDEKLFTAASVDFAALDRFAFASRKLPEYMHFRLLSCPRCSVLYASPTLPPELLAVAYRDAGFDATSESKYAAATYAALVKKHLRKRGRALDIGAGDGAFIESLLDLGFSEVVGIEPSTAPLAAASRRIRPNLRQELFVSETFPESTFDLVTCFQTIEHVYDPVALLDGIGRVLKPGGTAFLIFHDYEALSAKILKTRSPIFDVEHLQLFSSRSARFLLESRGFDNVGIEPIWNSYPLKYWCRLFPFPAWIKRHILNVVNTAAVGKLAIAVPAGNLAAWATKT